MANATNAGHSVEIEGKLYNLTVLNLTDWEWLTNEMRREWLAMGTSESSAFSKSILSSDGLGWMQTPAGLTRLAYRSLRPEHDDVTLDQCGAWLMKPETALFKAVLDLVLESLPKGGKGGTASAQKKRATKSKTGQQ